MYSTSFVSFNYFLYAIGAWATGSATWILPLNQWAPEPTVVILVLFNMVALVFYAIFSWISRTLVGVINLMLVALSTYLIFGSLL